MIKKHSNKVDCEEILLSYEEDTEMVLPLPQRATNKAIYSESTRAYL